MRDIHIQAIDRKIQRIRTYRLIGQIIAVTLLIVSLILIFSTLNTVMMIQTDTLDKLNLIDQSIDTMQENRSEANIGLHTGTFTISHYCLENYPHICNDGDSTQTASGETPIPYYTIAADKSIPFGTKMEIDGQVYEVMDRGGNIIENRIDIAVPTHIEAIRRGKITREVFMEVKE
jgi:3D (Asp-Asp-Asp) domain-containing protein